MRGTLCLGALLLAVPARGESRRPSRHVPLVTSAQAEEQDPDTRREPSRRDLMTLVKHAADLITDRNTRKEEVSGVDFFMDRLQAKLDENGSDFPRYEILRNAKDGRDALRDGYEDLRRALEPMLETREILLETLVTLEKAADANDRAARSARGVSDRLRDTSAAMQPDAEPPESPGQPVDPSELYAIQPLSRELEPLEQSLERAAEKAARAQGWIQSAEQRVALSRTFAETARTLDERAVDRLADSRTQRSKKSIHREDSSHFVLKNANSWLERAVKAAKKAHALLEKLTQPEKGLRKASTDARKADESNQKAKDGGIASAERVNAAHRRISEELRERWRREVEPLPDGDPEKEKRKAEIKEQARAAKEGAEKASERAGQSSERAEKDAEAARRSFSESGKELEELLKLLGEGDARELAEIPEYQLTASAPREGPKPAGGKAGGRKVRSKPLKYPRVLDEEAGAVIRDTYGEGSFYGTPQ